MENRFIQDKEIFKLDHTVDGVYNAIGVHFYKKVSNKVKEELNLTTVTERLPPDELFENLLNGKKGYFSIDGLTIKKDVIKKIGYFNEKLVVAEDTDLLLKMAILCKLVSGNIINPVAMRGVHHENVFDKPIHYKVYRQQMYESVIQWSLKRKISKMLQTFIMFLKYILTIWQFLVQMGSTGRGVKSPIVFILS